MNFKNKITKLDIALASIVSLFVFLMIFCTRDAIGFVRDEGFYMKAANEMADWYESIERSFAKGEFAKPFSQSQTDRYFSFNHEHPPFMKELFGLSNYIFHRKLKILETGSSARLVAAFFAALTALMIYLFGQIFFNRITAVTAPLLFFMMPHLFFHSHLACFDVPILFFWSATFILYIFCIKTGRLSIHILTAVFFALAMATKHNVLFVPIILFASWLCFYFFSYRKENGGFSIKHFFTSVPKVFYFMVLISIPLYFLLWPWMWHDTVNRVGEYMAFHTQHVNYTNYYFGQELATGPFPFSFPWAMTLFTTPLPQLICFFAGIIWFCMEFKNAASTKDKESSLAMISGSLFPIFLIALPSVPIFGGIKHWFTGYPLMLTAGVFFVGENLKFLVKTDRYKEVFVALVFFAAAISLVQPNVKFAKRGPAFYNLLIGGAEGAAELRMQRNFWGYDVIDLTETLNKNAPLKSKVYIMGAYEGLNYNSFNFMKEEGLVREDLIGVNNIHDADFAFFFFEKQNENLLNEIAYEFGTAAPIAISSVDSVLYSALFRRTK